MIASVRTALRWLLAIVFALAGYFHIVSPEPFLAITPDWVPMAEQVILLTGIAEFLGAAGLMVPALRGPAGWGLAAYTVCVFPANINHAVIDLTNGTGLPLAYHLPRLLFQPVILWACMWAAELIDWPFGRRRP